MLTDKHISQEAGYLLDEVPNGWDIQASLPNDVWKVFIAMYKMGYQQAWLDFKEPK